jgi:hypothetical protein
MTKLTRWPLLLGVLCVACDVPDSFAPDPTPSVDPSAYPAMSQQSGERGSLTAEEASRARVRRSVTSGRRACAG